MQSAVAYYRVSTQRQGRSGLGRLSRDVAFMRNVLARDGRAAA
jgi:hypothetical protein